MLAYSAGTTEQLTRAEVTGLISVHTAARHRAALLAPIESRVYVLLPDLPANLPMATVRGWAHEVVEAARDHLGVPLRAALGSTVEGLAQVPDSRAQADRILDAMGAAGSTSRSRR